MLRTLALALLLVIVLPLVGLVVRPLDAERFFGPKPAANAGLRSLPDDVRARHDALFVADLHADPLLWSRNLLKRSTRGHLDIPRMIDGGLDLQLFMAVTDAPFDSSGEAIPRGFDQTGLLAALDHWPFRTWASPRERALYMAARLQGFAAGSKHRFQVITTRDQLAAYRQKRESGERSAAGVLGIEGAEPLEGSVGNLDSLFAAGYRVMGLAHYWDSAMSGSSSGVQKPGLTAEGRRAVGRMEQLGMTVDVAHASERATLDVLDMARRPILASHVGVRSICAHSRNLSDAVIDRIAANGGVIGIGFFPEVTCGRGLDAVVRSILYVRNRVGAEHVALGSGFDAPVDVPIDALGLAELTAALEGASIPSSEIRLIMGENVYRILMQNLPPAPGTGGA